MTKIKLVHHIQYQPSETANSRPQDWGACHSYTVEEDQMVCLIPQVGDYVELIPVGATNKYLSFCGKVRSRLFRQFTHVKGEEGSQETTEIHVAVTIVIEKTDDDWGLLVKE